MTVTNTRVAIVGASSLRGKELVDALSDSDVRGAEPTTKAFAYKTIPGGKLELVVH